MAKVKSGVQIMLRKGHKRFVFQALLDASDRQAFSVRCLGLFTVSTLQNLNERRRLIVCAYNFKVIL